MFNLTKREKAMRTMVLDGCINPENIKMLGPVDAENFIQAIALQTNLKLERVQELIGEEGLSLEIYPRAKELIKSAIAFYGSGAGGDS